MTTHDNQSPPLPWYKDGLKFKCTACGKCCTGSKGLIFVTEDEIIGMAAFLKITPAFFKQRYLRLRNNRYVLVEKKSMTAPGSFDCIFLKDKKCEVYGERPLQCRTYPWWPENLNSKESFALAALECEGVNDDAPVVPLHEILKALSL
jgi:Fe-S-cluster containining protein